MDGQMTGWPISLPGILTDGRTTTTDYTYPYVTYMDPKWSDLCTTNRLRRGSD